MPDFKVTGYKRGGQRRRLRNEQYRARDIDEARRKAEENGTDIETIEQLPLPPASEALLAGLKAWRVAPPDSGARIECAMVLLSAAMRRGKAVDFQLGTVYNDDFEQVPWVARLWPEAFHESAQGLRVAGRVEAIGKEHMIGGEDQTYGSRRVLIENIEDLWPAE